MGNSLKDEFCPRHGRASRPAETPGLRCDCLDVIKDAVGALKRGKWASAPMQRLTPTKPIVDEIEERIDRAIDEALLAGYRLGLAGGAPRERVRTCAKCKRAWLMPSNMIESNGLCFHCAFQEIG